MFNTTLNVGTDTKVYKALGFVLKADSDTKQNVWYCKLCDGSFILASEITGIAVPRRSNVKPFTRFPGNGCMIEFFDWLDVNKADLEDEGFNVADYQSIG